MPEEACVIVQTTLDSDEKAAELAAAILEGRLAACVQRLPVKSTFRWKGKVESADEVLVIMKTRAALVEPLIRFIRDRHPYELPEIVVTPVIGGLPDYLEWVQNETDH